MDRFNDLDIPELLDDALNPTTLALVVYDMQVGILSQIADSDRVLANVLRVLGARDRRRGLGTSFGPGHLTRGTRPFDVWRVYMITAAFAVIVGAADVVTGANYMYLRHKPERSSPLDVMGPWPWYILAGAAFGLAVFGVLAALARVGGVTDSDTTRRPAWSPRPRDAS
jgi:hypothetical protein